MKIILLDRDGVINEFPGRRNYVTSFEGFKLLPNAKESIARLFQAGFKIFVLSNQACISKGLITQNELDRITQYLESEIELAGGKIEKVLYCTHTDEQNCNCRKPKTGLIHEAIDDLNEIDFFVGDSIRDVKTGKAVGCKTILVLSGRASLDEKESWEVQPDFIVKDISEATQIILNNQKK